MQAKPPAFDCLTCGACCACVEVVLERGDNPPAEYRNGPRMRLIPYTDGRCAALGGCVGEKVGCRCYETRPAICRRVKVGDPMCLAARYHFGLPGGDMDDRVVRDLLARFRR